jgi:hypothetical protein
MTRGFEDDPPGSEKETGQGHHRAEETLERWGLRIGQRLGAATARAREQAEDVWAEAQTLRRGERQ